MQAASDCEPLLKLMCEDRVAEVVVTERVTGSAGRTRVSRNAVHQLWGGLHSAGPMPEEKTPEQELKEELLCIIASFAGKLYGMRSH